MNEAGWLCGKRPNHFAEMILASFETIDMITSNVCVIIELISKKINKMTNWFNAMESIERAQNMPSIKRFHGLFLRTAT